MQCGQGDKNESKRFIVDCSQNLEDGGVLVLLFFGAGMLCVVRGYQPARGFGWPSLEPIRRWKLGCQTCTCACYRLVHSDVTCEDHSCFTDSEALIQCFSC